MTTTTTGSEQTKLSVLIVVQPGSNIRSRCTQEYRAKEGNRPRDPPIIVARGLREVWVWSYSLYEVWVCSYCCRRQLSLGNSAGELRWSPQSHTWLLKNSPFHTWLLENSPYHTWHLENSSSHTWLLENSSSHIWLLEISPSHIWLLEISPSHTWFLESSPFYTWLLESFSWGVYHTYWAVYIWFPVARLLRLSTRTIWHAVCPMRG